MKKIFSCRRSSLALIGMSMLFILAIVQGVAATQAVALGIAGLGGSVAFANAIDKKGSTNAKDID